MLALSLIDYNKKNPSPWLSMVEAWVKKDESRTKPMPKTERFTLPFDCLLCASASSLTPNAGLAVCVVEFYECVKFTKEYEATVCCEVYDGWVYRMRNLRWLSRKFPVLGQMGFYEVELPSDVMLFVPTHDQLFEKVDELLKLPLP